MAQSLTGPLLPSSAIYRLNLTPQEANLYAHHVNNLKHGLEVQNEDGSTSTILQRVVEHKGRYYNIPSVWDGKILNTARDAMNRAAQAGWDYWPSYSTPDEADSRYMDMHQFMEMDVP